MFSAGSESYGLAGAPVKHLIMAWERLQRSPLSARLAKGAVWTIFGTALARVLGLFSSVLAARFLSKTAFGELAVVQSTVAMFGTFAGLGLGVTATKYVAEWRDNQPARCGRVVALMLWVASVGGLFGTLMCILGAPWLAAHTMAAPQLAPVLRQSSLLVLFSTVQNVYTGALAGMEAFQAVACVNLLGGVLGAPLVALGALKFGLPGAVGGTILQSLLACVAGHWVLLRQGRKMGIAISIWPGSGDIQAWLSEGDILWRFSVPAFLSSTLVGPVNWVCNMLLVNQRNGYAEAALLSAANQWKNFVGFLPLMLGSVLVPMLANLHAAGRGEDFVKLVKRQLIISSGLCLGLGLPLMLFSSMLMRCYGRDFVEGAPVLVLTLATTAIAATNNLLSKSMQSAGRAWLDLGFSGIWAVALVVASFWLIPRHGAMGVAIAQAFAAGVLGLWQWQVLRRILPPAPTPLTRLNNKVLKS
jgi:O-antigen/teichoic acid export membrane protein